MTYLCKKYMFVLPVKSMCPSFQAVPLALDTWLPCKKSQVSTCNMIGIRV